LDNPHDGVSAIDYAPNQPRPRYIRPVIIFLHDSRHLRVDSANGAKEVREPRSGDVIWHNPGEDARLF